MKQAIKTKYLGPTNYRGARVKASYAAGSIVINWDYELNVEQNHEKAVKSLIKELGWTGKWVGGFYNNEGYFVQVIKGDK